MSDNTIASLMAEAQSLQQVDLSGGAGETSLGSDGNGFTVAGGSSATGYSAVNISPTDGLVVIDGIQMHRNEAEVLGLLGKPEASAQEADPKAETGRTHEAEPEVDVPELSQETVDGAQYELMLADNKLDNVQAGLDAVAAGDVDASDLIAQAVDAGVEMGSFVDYHSHQANSMLKAAGVSMTAQQISSVPGLSDAVTSAYLAGDADKMALHVKAYQAALTG